MKKASILLVFLALAVYSFADEDHIPNKYLFIEGTGERADHLDFFLKTFHMEADGAGYIITETKEEAAFTFKFNTGLNVILDENGIERMPQAGDNRFVLQVSLINNHNDEEILFFDFFYSNLDEVNEYNTYSLFQKATIYIPAAETEIITISKPDRDWQYKWVYFRASINYPVTFYLLQPDGLIGGYGVYEGPPESPNEVSPLDHKILPYPGLTLGVEVQFLNFLSLEVNLQFSMGDPLDNSFVNMSMGTELKYNHKTRYFMLQPYAAFVLPLNTSSVFYEFPSYSIGGGIQIATWGVKNGSFFVDVNYMISFTDAVMYNYFGDLFPEPEFIHFKRSVLGIGLGYKYGLFNRKQK